jgi:hypothetical protein
MITQNGMFHRNYRADDYFDSLDTWPPVTQTEETCANQNISQRHQLRGHAITTFTKRYRYPPTHPLTVRWKTMLENVAACYISLKRIKSV